ncbi:MAG: hypothetical protein Q9181_005173 [Wetmoreana brouardii]
MFASLDSTKARQDSLTSLPLSSVTYPRLLPDADPLPERYVWHTLGVPQRSKVSTVTVGLRRNIGSGSLCALAVLEIHNPTNPKSIRAQEATILDPMKYFKGSDEPFSVTIAGTELYIITSSQDMSLVYRNTTTLSFDEFIQDLHVAFEMSASGRRIMWDQSKGKCLLHVGTDLHRAQLHPGEHLDDLTQALLKQIEQRLTWDQVLAYRHRLVREDSKQNTLSLYDWCASVLVPAASVAFFGEALLRINEHLTEEFLAFDEDSWMITYRYPRFLARNMHYSKDRNMEALICYFRLPLQDRPGACYYVKSLEARKRAAAMSDRDMAISFQLFYWVTNANAFKVCFWLLTFLLHQPQTLEVIRAETQPSIINGKVNIVRLLQCTLLDAAFNETLRLTSGASSARTVVSSTPLRNKVLRKDTKLLMPYRQLHFQEIFGPQVKEFRPERFLGKSDVGRSSEFKPFGGGITYCSGRFIAKREVMAFVALVLHQYNLELDDPKQALPRLDEQKPSLGVIGPVKGDDTSVVIRPRAVSAKRP